MIHKAISSFGNSVPTKMIEAVANKVYNVLKENGEINEKNICNRARIVRK